MGGRQGLQGGLERPAVRPRVRTAVPRIEHLEGYYYPVTAVTPDEVIVGGDDGSLVGLDRPQRPDHDGVWLTRSTAALTPMQSPVSVWSNVSVVWPAGSTDDTS
jgi:hypothetical protein